MGRDRRSFTKEFKAEAVRLLQESGRPSSEIARQLGVRPSLLRRWKRELIQDTGPPAPITDYEAAYRQLEREIAQLRQERDFLKEAAAFFAKDPGGDSR